MRSSRLRAPLGWFLAASLLCGGAARADVRLEIEGGDRALHSNIAAHIGPLPEEDALGRAYLRRMRASAREAAEALGYYNSEISLVREEIDDDVVLRLKIVPGPRVHIGRISLRLYGEAEQDRDFARLLERLPIREGAPLDHGQYEAAKRSLQNLALRRGYFDARYRLSRVEVDAVDNTAHVILEFDSGRRYAFGEVSFSETPFRDELLRRLIPFEVGAPYEAEKIAEFNRDLLDTRYFEEVRVRPLPEQAVARQVPVEVMLREQDRNRVGVGVGYSTDAGPRLRLSWDMPWRNASGHSLQSALELSGLRQQLSAQYQIPLSKPTTDFLQIQGGFLSESFEDTDTDRYTFSVQRQQEFASRWQRTVFVRLERELFEQADQEGATTLVLPGVSFTRTRVEGGVDPSRGDRLLLTTEATDPALGSDVRLARIRFGGRILRSFHERHQLFFRVDAGATWTDDFAEVPPSLRFFAGGDQSVRGFDYNSLAPRADNGELLGGRYLFAASAEYAWQPWDKWRLSTFVDAGNAFDEFADDALKVGTGFGIAWISPVGPIRLDFAWGVSEDDVPFRVHFSMGPRL